MQDFTVQSTNQTVTGVDSVALLNRFMRGVYFWMMAGLLLTAVTAWMTANSYSLQRVVFSSTYVFYGLLIGEFAVVVFLSARIAKLSATMATGLFILYSVLNGLTLSVIFLAYTYTDITAAFVISAAMFGAMSVYGMTTKRDLTSWRSFLMMGLVGLIIAMIVNIFMGGDALRLVISLVAVVLFTLLTAYDTKKLKEMGESAPIDQPEVLRRGIIMGALTLYLDFINLFLHMLRILSSLRR